MSYHVNKVNINLNETSRIITRYFKTTFVENIKGYVHKTSAIVSSDIRRNISSQIERHIQVNYSRYLLFGREPLKSV